MQALVRAEAETGQGYVERQRHGPAIEDGHGQAAIGKRFAPHLQWPFGVDAIALAPGRVLIERDDLAIEENAAGFGGHIGEVVAGEQGRAQHGPETHVGPVLRPIHAAVADLQHVRIVPVAGAGEGAETGLLEADPGHRGVVICDVASGAPGVAADRGTPAPNGLPAAVGEREHNRTAGVDQGVVHGAVDLFHHDAGFLVIVAGARLEKPGVGAEVIFEEVDTPLRVGVGILLLVAERAFKAGTGLVAG